MTGHVFAEGTIVSGRFRVDKLLGAGGYGEVYQAEQLSMGRKVALKVLRAHLADKETALDRFRNEARFACKLRHPNTVVYHDFGDDPDLGVFWLAMEYLEGWSLEQRIRAEGVLSLADCADILEGVAGSLHEAHGLGLVHRDIKPANIMLVTRGGDPNFVKVIDFGIAKAVTVASSDGEHSLTETGTVLGSPSYMAPEQIRREHGPMGAHTDVYAMAVMAYRLLTGVLPFRGATPIEVAMAHLTAEPPRLGALGDTGAPPALERLLLAGLSKDIAARPQRADHFASGFREALSAPVPAATTPTGMVQDPDALTLDAVAHPPPTTPPPLRWTTRHKTQLLLTISVILLGFAVIVGLGAFGIKELSHPDTQDDGPSAALGTVDTVDAAAQAEPDSGVADAGGPNDAGGPDDSAAIEVAPAAVAQNPDLAQNADVGPLDVGGSTKRPAVRPSRRADATAAAANTPTAAPAGKTPTVTKAALVDVHIGAAPWGSVSVAGKSSKRRLKIGLAPGTYTVKTWQRDEPKRAHRIHVTASGNNVFTLPAGPK